MAKRSNFWAGACTVMSAPLATAAGAVKGTYDAVTGNGSFADGFSEAAERVVDTAEEFGAEHGHALTAAVITVAARVSGGAIDNQVNHPGNSS